ncbi:alpha/beta hydrolase fold protein [[Leptolyngbya] sp. PCC 7376]|uniref:alpha/beta fold hydrolase n=1 Tax=[Leptolyngbya] sp. PCC 7376 TaxID=111781 RepID=UPI00029F2E94|nr:alpha/beta hydrolase [[Leptolyngbya] sp. PCC 7376]AFY37435.1 alpha/beta hydrolase fold protein [[Leptolyngbya] sp. PCC 7376]
MVCVVRNSRLKLSQGQIFWRETGQGNAIVFIHGECRDSSQWSNYFEEISKKYHCFAPDLLGFGDSERSKVPYSIQWESEVLEELFDNLRLKQFYLVGDGLGAWVATRYAVNHPEQIKGLVLRSPLGVETDQNPSYFWEKCLVSPLPIVPWLLKLISPIAPILGLRKKIQNAFEHRKTLRRSPGTCKLLFRGSARLKSEFLNFQLAQLTTPTLILSTQDDSSVQIAQSQTYNQLIKHSEYKGLKNESEAIDTIQTWLQTQHSSTKNN